MTTIDHYVDIQLRPDPYFAATHLMNALFAKLHCALAKISSHDIGVSFPAADPRRPSMGEHLRLHGPAKALQELFTENWLVGMHDHVLVGNMARVPTSTSYRYVRRIQAKSSPERIRRRQMKRHDLSEEQARKCIPQVAARRLSLPYLTLPSQSTGQTFRLFVDQVAAADFAAGDFNAYGLSGSATVPWF